MVVNGAAATPYTVPNGTPAGSYTIQAVYSGTSDFKPITATGTLTVGMATTMTVAVNTPATFSDSSQSVTLNATVTSQAGPVNEATVTFTVLNGTTAIGPAIRVPISSNGTASTSYPLSAGLAGKKYTIQAVYDGGPDFKTSTDKSHLLTVNPAATNVEAANQTTTFSTSAQMVTLTAMVGSPAGTVGEGSVTFTVLNGTQDVGTPTMGNVTGGSVMVNYTIPANEPVGSYTIQAVYNATADFSTSIDKTNVLTIGAAAPAFTTTLAATGPAAPGQLDRGGAGCPTRSPRHYGRPGEHLVVRAQGAPVEFPDQPRSARARPVSGRAAPAARSSSSHGR